MQRTFRAGLRRSAVVLLAAAALTAVGVTDAAAQALPGQTPAECARTASQQAVRSIDPRLARTNPREYTRQLNQAIQSAVRSCVRAGTRPPTTPTTPSTPTGPRQSGRAYASSEVGNPNNPNQLVSESSTGGFSFICRGSVDRASLRLHDPSRIVTQGPRFQRLGANDELEMAYYDWVATDPLEDNVNDPRHELWVDGTCNGDFVPTARQYQPRTPEPTGPGGGGSGGL